MGKESYSSKVYKFLARNMAIDYNKVSEADFNEKMKSPDFAKSMYAFMQEAQRNGTVGTLKPYEEFVSEFGITTTPTTTTETDVVAEEETPQQGTPARTFPSPEQLRQPVTNQPLPSVGMPPTNQPQPTAEETQIAPIDQQSGQVQGGMPISGDVLANAPKQEFQWSGQAPTKPVVQPQTGMPQTREEGMQQGGINPVDLGVSTLGSFETSLIGGIGSELKGISELGYSLDKKIVGALEGTPLEGQYAMLSKPEDSWIYQAGQGLQNFAEENLYRNPEYQGGVADIVGQGLGSIAAISATGGLNPAGGVMKLGTKAMTNPQLIAYGAKQLFSRPSISGALMMVGQETDEARKLHRYANSVPKDEYVFNRVALGESEEDASKAYDKLKSVSEDEVASGMIPFALFSGATEAIPMERLFTRLGKASKDIVISAFKNGGIQGTEEAIQEMIQQTISNVGKGQVYNEAQRLSEGLVESAEGGGATGFVLGSLLTALAGKRANIAKAVADGTMTKEEAIAELNDVNKAQTLVNDKLQALDNVVNSVANEDVKKLTDLPESKTFFDKNEASLTNPITTMPTQVETIMDKIDGGILISAESLHEAYQWTNNAVKETLANQTLTPAEKGATLNILNGMLTDIDRANTEGQRFVEQVEEVSVQDRVPAVREGVKPLPQGQAPKGTATPSISQAKAIREENKKKQAGTTTLPSSGQTIVTPAPATTEAVATETEVVPEGGETDKTGLVLYHGSPHSFENFDISKLGSGEGAQAFGYGLYFTNEVDIAKGYANRLGSKKNFWEALKNGNEISLTKEDFDFIKDEIEALGFDGYNAEQSDIGDIKVDGKNEFAPDVLEALAVAFGKNAKSELESFDLTKEQIDRLLDIKRKISDPQLYKIAIHEGKSPSEYDYIDWREPLTDSQRKKIGGEFGDNVTGEEVYKTLSKQLGSDQKASEFLLSKGIDGISYKSEKGTGGKTGKGRNYVVFDANAIRIDEINQQKQPTPTPQSEVTAENPALADVESTAKALDGVDINKLTPLQILADESMPVTEKKTIPKGETKGNWVDVFNNATDIVQQSAIIRALVGGTDNQTLLNRYLSILEGLPNDSNVLFDILGKLKTNEQKALAVENVLKGNYSNNAKFDVLNYLKYNPEIDSLVPNDIKNEPQVISQTTPEAISSAYHSAKAKPESERTAQETELITQVEQLLTPTQDAVQKQTAGQVPVQSGTTSSQEVAKGEPQAEPQSTADKGQTQETGKEEVGGETPAEVASSEIANISDKTSVRDLASMQDGEVSAGVFSELNKGDKITIGGNEYVVTTKTKGTKKTEFKNEKGEDRYYTKSTITLKKVNKDGSLGSPISGTFVEYSNRGSMFVGGNAWRNLSRDIEGDITTDLINENNKFHEPSQSFKLAQQYVDKINTEVEKQQAAAQTKPTAETVATTTETTGQEGGEVKGGTTTTEVTLTPVNATDVETITKIENATEKGRELALAKPVNKWVKRAFDTYEDISSRAKKAGIYDGKTLKIGGQEIELDTPAKFKAFLAQSQNNFDAINEAVKDIPSEQKTDTNPSPKTVEEKSKEVFNDAKSTFVFPIGLNPKFKFDSRLPENVVRFFKKYFRPRGLWTKGMFSAKRRMENQISSQVQKSEFLVRDLRNAVKEAYPKGVTQEQLQAMNDVLQGMPREIPANLYAPLTKMREHIDELSQLMISEGIIDERLVPVFDANMGIYTTRTYAIHNDPKSWLDYIENEPEGQQIRNNAVNFLRQATEAKADRLDKFADENEKRAEKLFRRAELAEGDEALMLQAKADEVIARADKQRELARTMREQDFDAQVVAFLEKKGQPLDVVRKGNVGAKDLGILKKRKNILETDLALMGEEKDPLTNYTMSVAKMSALIANNQFLNEVKAQGVADGLFTKTPKGKNTAEIASASTDSMSPLNGLYTTKDIAEAFKEFDANTKSPWYIDAMLWFNAAVKVNKTVLSQGTHIRNFISNPIIELANGYIPTLKGKAIDSQMEQILNRRFGDKEKLREYIIKLTELGVLGQGGNYRDILSVYEDLKGNKYDYQKLIEPKITSAAKKSWNIAQKVYKGGDEFWKVVAFENERAVLEKAYGDTKTSEELDQMAADIIRKTRVDYSMVPKAVKAINKIPFTGTFVTFPAEVLRIGFNIPAVAYEEMNSGNKVLREHGIKRMAGYLTAMTLPYGVKEFAKYLLGMDDEEEEARKKFLAPWAQNSTLIWIGKDRYIDTGFSDAFSILKKPIVAFSRGKSAAEGALSATKEFLGPVISEEIGYKTLKNVSDNTDEFGNPIYDENADAGTIYTQVSTYVLKQVEPGTVSQARRLYLGETGALSEKGQQYRTGDEVLNAVFGIKPVTINWDNAVSYKFRDAVEGINNSNKFFLKKSKELRKDDKEGRRKAAESTNLAVENAYNDLREYYTSALKIGMIPQKVVDIMKQSGVPKELMYAVVNNTGYKNYIIVLNDGTVIDRNTQRLLRER